MSQLSAKPNICDLKQDTQTLKSFEIAKKYNVNKRTIGRWLKSYDIKMPSRVIQPPHIEELKLIIQKKSCKKAAKELKVGVNTVYKWIKNYEIELDPIRLQLKSPPRKKFKKYMLNHTHKETANHFNINERTMRKWLKQYDLYYEEYRHPNCPNDFSDLQKDFLMASMLGDGCIGKKGYFRFLMKSTSEEYVEWSRRILEPFSKKLVKKSFLNPFTLNNNKANYKKYLHSSGYDTISHTLFKNMRETWYPDGKKLVPKNIKLNPRIIAHWYLHDGCNVYYKKSIVISTNAFSLEDVKFLKTQLEEYGFNPTVRLTRKNQPVIGIGTKDYYRFMELISPYVVWNCFKYKTDISNAPSTRPGYGPGKITFEQAKEIRKLYQTGEFTQEQLGKKYGINQSNIGCIIRNKIHKEYNLSFGGNAITRHIG